jgi:putative NIF3 family GTP cyclohydrolase 1 type 2
MVMDIGHYFSEYGIVEVFANILSKNFPTFAVSISKKNNNPIYYY